MLCRDCQSVLKRWYRVDGTVVQYKCYRGTVRVVRGTVREVREVREVRRYGYGGTVRVVHLVHVVSCCVNLYKIWAARSYSKSGTSGDKTKLQGGTTKTCHFVWCVDCKKIYTSLRWVNANWTKIGGIQYNSCRTSRTLSNPHGSYRRQALCFTHTYHN